MKIKTPYYLLDEKKILKNMKIIEYVRAKSGAKSVLALKCFSVWGVFPLMKKYMAGTTSSSLYEAKLGHEKFAGETHAFCVAYSKDDIQEIKKIADKVIFNSVSQLEMFYKDVKHLQTGLRINPGISYSHFHLADPARKNSRLGVFNKSEVLKAIDKINGVMFHCNCENDNFSSFSAMLDKISIKYKKILAKADWVSLGGGIYFTKSGYPLNKFCKKLKDFSEEHSVQVYLEPGESAITQSCELVTSVLDIVHNGKDIAVVDASTEAHMLDLLIYQTPAKINTKGGRHGYIIAGKSCLAGDIFGEYKFEKKLKIGSKIKFCDAAGYTMVKKNWFNGLNMPSIAVKRLNGKTELLRQFTYSDFYDNMS